jgi:hypothetical protein
MDDEKRNIEIYKHWKPTSENINNLPAPFRKYIHDLITNCDPAGMVAENITLKDNVDAISKENADLRERIRIKDHYNMIRCLPELCVHVEKANGEINNLRAQLDEVRGLYTKIGKVLEK